MQVCMHCGQIANFKTNSNIPTEKIAIAINSKIKKSIVIKNAEEVYSKFSKKKMLKEELKQIEMHCRLEQDYMNTKDN